MTTTREQIIQATCFLLEKQGYPATGLNEIVRRSGAPKGSLYHYFPEGKEQLVSEAVLYSGDILVNRLRAELDKYPDPVQAIYVYILRLADKIEEKQFAAGNPLSIVAIESAVASERISLACRQVYAQLQSAFEEKMTSSGMSSALAKEKACLIMVSLEGGILLSRVHRTPDPLRTLAAHFRESIQDATLPKAESP